MPHRRTRLIRGILFLFILGICFAASRLLPQMFDIPGQISVIFAFGVFIAALTCLLMAAVRKSESARVESDKEKMRANLLRAISHDLRTPLTAIYGSSTVLRENASTLTPEQTDRMLQSIQEDAQWLIRMVENLLSVTRMDGGHPHLTTTTAAADELVDAALVKFYKRYPSRTVSTELPEEIPFVSVDYMLIEQVLINLLENAVQHATGMTKLQIRITALRGEVVFEVIDNGSGIPENRLPGLFNGLPSDSRRPSDTSARNIGIGLSLCATIVRAHGGRIMADNAPAGGAIFRFVLPREEAVSADLSQSP